MKVTTQVDQGEEVPAFTRNGKLWTAEWSPRNYLQGLHVLQVKVEDEGGEVSQEEHQFSLDGTAPVSGLLGRLVLLVDLAAFFQVRGERRN